MTKEEYLASLVSQFYNGKIPLIDALLAAWEEGAEQAVDAYIATFDPIED